ncbi:hypothetical protein H4P12_17790 [Paracoccus sp. 11-3]|uniref:Uncharacterized protein n=2 Tax=Paracoccus amoyensis TaxID=2760093 RepID=A0A926GKE1_9RHOB|nr:hypothetical protein [Paracoccus amoyensis]
MRTRIDENPIRHGAMKDFRQQFDFIKSTGLLDDPGDVVVCIKPDKFGFFSSKLQKNIDGQDSTSQKNLT